MRDPVVNHRPRKRFGQNFLVDQGVIDRIITAIAPGPDQRIVEIGPGQEALTGPLAASGADLAVVEIDRDLAATLRRRRPRLEVVEADALTVDFAALSSARPYRLVGNLPYNISTPILFHLLDQSPPPVDMHFMLQKEVVERMAASAGSRDWGRLGLMCQNRARVAPLFEVPAESFHPRPRVASAVVRLEPRDEPLVSQALESAFDEVVRQAFSQRRKTLRNSLGKLLDATRIEAAGVDPAARPERIDLEGFRELAMAVQRRRDEDRGG